MFLKIFWTVLPFLPGVYTEISKHFLKIHKKMYLTFHLIGHYAIEVVAIQQEYGGLLDVQIERIYRSPT